LREAVRRLFRALSAEGVVRAAMREALLVLGALVAAWAALRLSGVGAHAAHLTRAAVQVAVPTPLWSVEDDAERGRGFVEAAFVRLSEGAGPFFDVQRLRGRAAVAHALGGEATPWGRAALSADVGRMPSHLWRAWAAAALAFVRGGLVLPGGSLLLRGGGEAVRSGLAPYAAASLGHGAAWSAGDAGREAWRPVFEAAEAVRAGGPPAWNAVEAGAALRDAGRALPDAPRLVWRTRSAPPALPLTTDELLGRSAESVARVNGAPSDFAPPVGAALVLLDVDAVLNAPRFDWFVRRGAGALLSAGRARDDVPCLWEHLCAVGSAYR
jgi:hypothetical protein